VSIDVIIAELTRTLAAETLPRERTLSFIGIGSSNSGHTAQDAETFLADGFGRD